MNKLKTTALICACVMCVSVIMGAFFMPVCVKALGIEGQSMDVSTLINAVAEEDTRINVVLNDKGEERKFLVEPNTCGEFLKEAGVVLMSVDSVNVDADTVLWDNIRVNIERTEYETETRIEDIPYGTKEIGIDTIPKGSRELVSKGVAGKISRTYLVKYVNGKKTDEALYVETPVSAPVDEVVNVGVGGTVTAKDGTVYSYNYRRQMEATAYTYVPGKTTMTTATGETLRKGIVAVDPREIPMHTKMFITGSVEYGLGVAEDTGGVIKGNIIDLAYMSYDECIQFGRRQMQVYFLD